ncbi:MAG: chemotaxis protein CheW [Thermodesulfobacteriota bacterium]|nr:chemotaxis protein CheW [Thermodesulfobacteriota bacterium]
MDSSGQMELATFYVGEALYGMNILKVQEINKLMDSTSVPQAPEYVRGILNLRGQIVTVLDLKRKLGLEYAEISPLSRNIVVQLRGEYFGFLVDSIGDVVRVDLDKVEDAPANIGGVQGDFFDGVFKTEKALIGILNIEESLKMKT